jgi:hypothetical protein
VQLLEDYRFGSAPRFRPLGLQVFAAAPDETPAPTRAELDAMWADAITEDFQADHQAAPVLLTADGALQRFAKGVLGCARALPPASGRASDPTARARARTPPFIDLPEALRMPTRWHIPGV